MLVCCRRVLCVFQPFEFRNLRYTLSEWPRVPPPHAAFRFHQRIHFLYALAVLCRRMCSRIAWHRVMHTPAAKRVARVLQSLDDLSRTRIMRNNLA